MRNLVYWASLNIGAYPWKLLHNVYSLSQRTSVWELLHNAYFFVGMGGYAQIREKAVMLEACSNSKRPCHSAALNVAGFLETTMYRIRALESLKTVISSVGSGQNSLGLQPTNCVCLG